MPTDRPAPARAPRRAVLGVILPLLGAVLSGAGAASAGPAQWAPFPVFEWTPPFDMASPRKERMYVPLDRAERDWRLCVSFPHLKDAYWLGVNYGLVDEAQRLGVGLHLYDAGGYDHLQTQVRQIEACVADKASAVIVAGIDADGLNDVLGRVHAAGIPIVDLVNGVSFARLDAKSLIDFYDSGFAAGRYIADRHKGEQRSISVLWFPGPKGASWVTRGNQGFVDALKDSNVKIVETAHGDTGKRTQARLIQAALERFPHVDYIAGTSVSAEAAVDIVRRKRIAETTRIVAYYFSPGVYRNIKRGRVLAAPSDLQVIQGRIAVDQAVRILEGRPYLKHVGPRVRVVDQQSLSDFDPETSLPPVGFNATFDVN